ncbi:hypothetical protein V8G54_016496 [Vigna mungo]|uniref:Uncharacterized protein n=1 Tax=Vigna mungo TaxID=3915 RepID=A0AAQ3NL93_VIGMU
MYKLIYILEAEINNLPNRSYAIPIPCFIHVQLSSHESALAFYGSLHCKIYVLSLQNHKLTFTHCGFSLNKLLWKLNEISIQVKHYTAKKNYNMCCIKMCTVAIANLTVALPYDFYIKITNVFSRITGVSLDLACNKKWF